MSTEAESGRIQSHGRGGAGNIGKERRDSTTKAEELVTPTLKSENYTTGRGGSGNMAKNDPQHPEIARKAQDVEAPTQREPEGNFHFGRGGAANIAKPATEDAKAAARANGEAKKEATGHGEHKGFAEKGKELMEKITGKK